MGNSNKNFFIKNKTGGFILIALSVALWGSEGIVAQLCYGEGTNVTMLMLMRYGIMAIIYLIIAKAIHRPILVTKGKRKAMVLISAMHLMAQLCLYLSFFFIPAPLTILFFYIYPSMASLIARIFNKEPLGWGRKLALIISGIGLISLYWTTWETVSMIGIILAIVAALGYAVALTIEEKALPEIDKVSYNASLSIFIALAFVIYNTVGGSWNFDITTIGWVYIVVSAVFCTAVPFYLHAHGVAIVGAVDTSIISLLEPLSAAIFSYVVFKYFLNSQQMVGAILILAAIAVQQLYYHLYQKKKGVVLAEVSEVMK